MISTMAFTQKLGDYSMSLGLGAHAVDYTSVNPLHGIFDIKDYSILLPNMTVSRRLNSSFSFDIQNSTSKIDNKKLKIKNQNFILTGIGIRYQFANDYILPQDSWFDPYLRLSINYGYYNYSELSGKKKLTTYDKNYSKSSKVVLDRNFSEKNHNLVLNGGVGINFWIKPTFGINIESQYAYNYNPFYNTRCIDFLNHTVSLIFRLGHNNYTNTYDDDHDWDMFDLERYKYTSESEEEVSTNLQDSSYEEVMNKDKVQSTSKCNNVCDNILLENTRSKEIKCVKVVVPNSKKVKIKKYNNKNNCIIPLDVAYLDHYITNPSALKYIKKKVKDFKKKCPKILFNVGQSKLTPKVKRSLIKLVKVMKKYPEYVFFIEGHADSSGNLFKNRILSLKRSASSVKLFKIKGIAFNRMFIRGFGIDSPIDKNSTKKGKRNNRRVEIKLGIYKKDLYKILKQYNKK